MAGQAATAVRMPRTIVCSADADRVSLARVEEEWLVRATRTRQWWHEWTPLGHKYSVPHGRVRLRPGEAVGPSTPPIQGLLEIKEAEGAANLHSCRFPSPRCPPGNCKEERPERPRCCPSLTSQSWASPQHTNLQYSIAAWARVQRSPRRSLLSLHTALYRIRLVSALST